MARRPRDLAGTVTAVETLFWAILGLQTGLLIVILMVLAHIHTHLEGR